MIRCDATGVQGGVVALRACVRASTDSVVHCRYQIAQTGGKTPMCVDSNPGNVPPDLPGGLSHITINLSDLALGFTGLCLVSVSSRSPFRVVLHRPVWYLPVCAGCLFLRACSLVLLCIAPAWYFSVCVGCLFVRSRPSVLDCIAPNNGQCRGSLQC